MLQFKSRFPREVLLCRVCRFNCFDIFLVSFKQNGQSHEFCDLCYFRTTTSRRLLIRYHIMTNFPSFQVGDFYEAIGIDACILVEYAGLNPFGGLRSDSAPKAGCPVVVQNPLLFFFFLIILSVIDVNSSTGMGIVFIHDKITSPLALF